MKIMIGSVLSINNVPIRLTAERWAHIVESHDYMAGNQDIVFDTIENPEFIASGAEGESIAVGFECKTSISLKRAVVIYKEIETDGFIITSFLTSKPDRLRKRGVLWPK
ncbi:MAG: hypothetical protein RBT37_09205 [Dissulfurispiraceae bacterium]|nr:hypothetical protein [Dissulfurispiraceae bacterium]